MVQKVVAMVTYIITIYIYIFIETEVATKIKNFKGQYLQEKQKGTKSKTGTGTDEVEPVSKWRFLSTLQFLNDSVVKRSGISNLQVKESFTNIH